MGTLEWLLIVAVNVAGIAASSFVWGWIAGKADVRNDPKETFGVVLTLSLVWPFGLFVALVVVMLAHGSNVAMMREFEKIRKLKEATEKK
jgi:hypothetical protein